MTQVIRYGAGGSVYAGNVGPKSTESETTSVVEEVKEEAKVSISFTEDDSPISDDELVSKIAKNKSKFSEKN